jgi:hypothetical protein
MILVFLAALTVISCRSSATVVHGSETRTQ